MRSAREKERAIATIVAKRASWIIQSRIIVRSVIGNDDTSSRPNVTHRDDRRCLRCTISRGTSIGTDRLILRNAAGRETRGNLRQMLGEC